MKLLFFLLIFFLNISVFSQTNNIYVNEQIGLAVILPVNFNTPGVQKVITKDYKETKQKKSRENKDITESNSNRKPIISFRDKDNNSVIFFVKKPQDQPKDLKKYLGDQHKTILDSFKTTEKNIKYEEKTENEKIDSVNFIKSILTLKKEEKTSYLYVYTSEIKGYETHIIVFINDDNEGKELLESLKNSKFH
ncbi:hypothetical protein NZ698_12330 [Chryseobacterium sp. PBS4-4]|uniref:DUF4252 domain-containing protein n=1 Tax=Chryseobacterium edaphi TaxID=2976532 RepID=A0ABT2W6Z1_9FLAO|nr:hypothetical protein [Chryseobacterium edaphi]MCU7617988.1 hypothetical protein [Chryseobacterium edaphi]